MLGWLKKGRYAAKRLLFRISPAWAARRGVAFTLQAPSRQFLEAEVFSYINARAASLAHPAACLFIGVDKHNWHYPRLLSPAFHSIDCDPAHAVYGQPGLHVVGSALELDRHYRSAMFDFVIANGLLGFGVDTRGDCDRLLAQAHGVLAPGGLLVLGYNDTLNASRSGSKTPTAMRCSNRMCPPSTACTVARIRCRTNSGTAICFCAGPATEARPYCFCAQRPSAPARSVGKGNTTVELFCAPITASVLR